MKKRTQKLTTILLLIAMLLPLASCGNGGDTPETGRVSAESENGGAATDTDGETETTRLDYPDGLPEKDFGGAAFTVLGYDSTIGFIYAEELTGDVMGDSLYNRNLRVADRFGVDLRFIEGGDYHAITTLCNNAVTAGEDTYQMVASHVIEMGKNIASGIYQPVNDLSYVDFSKPWWSKSCTEDLAYHGKTYLAIGDFDLSAVGKAVCLVYNKDLAETYELPNIYETVRSGKWTRDELTRICEGTYVDVNGDGKKDEGDQYGFAIDSKGDANTYLWSFGKKVMTKNSDGEYDDTFYDEKLVSIVEWLYDIKLNDYVWTDTEWNTGFNAFMREKTLIANGNLEMTQWGMRDLELDYAIIPMPKWDETQQGYYTSVGGSHDIQGVLITAQDTDFVGLIVEALNAESWKSVTLPYCETTLKYKGARDEDSLEMIDITLAGRIYDFGFVYGGWGEAFWLQYCLNDNKSKDITSYVEKNKSKWDSTMAAVFATFDEYTKG